MQSKSRLTRNDILRSEQLMRATHLRTTADFINELQLNSHLNIIIFFLLLQGKGNGNSNGIVRAQNSTTPPHVQ
jgi:hypothetical protein